jgi:hypothetical protein
VPDLSLYHPVSGGAPLKHSGASDTVLLSGKGRHARVFAYTPSYCKFIINFIYVFKKSYYLAANTFGKAKL